MSATFTTSPTSPILSRDLRGPQLDFKKAKDQREKWSNGIRPSAGVKYAGLMDDELVGGSDSQKAKVRPQKQWSQIAAERKTHANVTPKPNACVHGTSKVRVLRKVDAMIDVHDISSAPLSRSLLELLPQHVNNTSSSIQLALRESSGDAGVLYSFDNKVTPGKAVDLGGLVELAEQKWKSEQTEKIVKGEYEVLDGEGEVMAFGGGKRGKGKSPKQKAKMDVIINTVDDDEGFELI